MLHRKEKKKVLRVLMVFLENRNIQYLLFLISIAKDYIHTANIYVKIRISDISCAKG